jgi:spoIIIJ-associated protein
MEWVETTGRSIEEAKDAALDQLGVDENDAEFDILEEPKFGLFGRLRAEARVRARVRPTKPRAKEDRRDRRRRRGNTADTSVAAGGVTGQSAAPDRGEPEHVDSVDVSPESTPRSGRSSAELGGAPSPRRRRRPRTTSSSRSNGGPSDERVDTAQEDSVERRRDEGAVMDVSLDEQGQVARQFLDELIHRMSLQAKITMSQPDDETVDFNLEGPSLGLLIGPKGTTLLALQDLTRTAVQRKTNAGNGRITVDVSGYRQKRKQALERFAGQLSEEVRSSGTRKVLEPMSAADRKIVHDTVNEIDGVTTTSEGEEPRRRVVILPSSD